jgi:hypothetical protein
LDFGADATAALAAVEAVFLLTLEA